MVVLEVSRGKRECPGYCPGDVTETEFADVRYVRIGEPLEGFGRSFSTAVRCDFSMCLAP